MSLVDYGSSEEEDGSQSVQKQAAVTGSLLDSAPAIKDVNNAQIVQYGNERYQDSKHMISGQPATKNMLTGHVEEEAFDESTFKIQHRTFQMLGYAKDPTRNSRDIVGDAESAKRLGAEDISLMRASKKAKGEVRKTRENKGDAGALDGDNAYRGPWAKYKEDKSSESEYEEEEPDEVQQTETEPAVEVVNDAEEENEEEERETTIFHGSQKTDYLGRTYMHVPRDLDVNLTKEPGSQECYMPKRKIHTWSGHAGGTTALRFFPKSGHLLLSAGNDGKVKLWDVYHKRELLRSYMGHNRTVKDITFNNDGTQFLSGSYDKTVKLWDTETGKVIQRFNTHSIVNCVKFNPKPDLHHMMLAGLANKKIVQFDTRTAEVIQEYDHHLGGINSITFVDEDHRFMTTSDDKSVRVWDWEINVPIKFLADPEQHSMPAVRLHPSGKYVAAQSMDNSVVVIGATDRFRMNRKKRFTGYNCAGYKLEVDFSPDGKYLMSGDIYGHAVFWDWKSTQIKSKIKAHEKPVLCIAAHPQEQSKVATSGLDAVIHYWD